MADRIELKVTADTQQASSNLARFSSEVDKAAAAQNKMSTRVWKTLTTDITKLGEDSNTALGKVRALGGGVLRVTGAVVGVTAAVGAAAYKIAEFAAAAEQQEMAITRLGPAYEAVRAATAGVVTAQDALKAQQTLVQAGLRVSTEQLATITRAAREYSRATGTEMTQSLEQLTDALRTGSGEGLGRFGVSLQQGVTGASAFTSALQQLTTQQQNTTVSSRTLREDLDKLPEGLMAVGRSILSVLEGPADALTRWLTGLVGASTSLRGVLSEIASAGDTLRQRERQEATDRANMQRLEAQEGLFRAAGAAGVSVGREAVRGLSPARLARLQQRIALLEGTVEFGRAPTLRGTARLGLGGLRGESFGASFTDVDTMARLTGQQVSTDAAARQQRRQASFQQALTELQDEQRAEAEAAQRAAQGPAVRRPTGGGGGAAATQQTTALETAKSALAQAQAQAQASGARVLEIDGPLPMESLLHFFARATHEQQLLNSAASTSRQQSEARVAARQQSESDFQEFRRGLQQRAQDERAKSEAAMTMQREAAARERETSFGGRFASALGIELDERGEVPALNVAQAGVDMLATSLSSLTSGFANLFNTLAAGSMSAGEAFQQFAAKTLSSLGEMAVNKGVFYTFEGIASLFTNPVAAPTYFAAGAGLIALGVGLGAAGSAVAPSAAPGGSSAPAAARSASGASPRGAGEGAGNVTIVLSSLVPPGPRELQGLVNAQRQAGRYGIDRDRMVPRQVRA